MAAAQGVRQTGHHLPQRPSQHLALARSAHAVRLDPGALIGIDEKSHCPACRGAVQPGDEDRGQLVGGGQQQARIAVIAELPGQVLAGLVGQVGGSGGIDRGKKTPREGYVAEVTSSAVSST
jgi:hypothetical protein